MKVLVVSSSLDLRYPYSSTPSWWQLLKALSEAGVEVIATPYQGQAMASLWWKSYPNPCEIEGWTVGKLKSRVRCWRRARSGGDKLGDRLIRLLAQQYVRPRWRRHLNHILEQERDVDAVLMLSVPVNHLTGVPAYLRRRFEVPVIYYDGDVPASLPRFGGFESGFNVYEDSNLSEYDCFLSNSKGGCDELKLLGAKEVHVLYFGVDSELFSPISSGHDIDVLFYGHGYEYRREWIEAMIVQPSRSLTNAAFFVRGTGFSDLDLGRASILPYLSFNALRALCCRSKLSLNITRRAHASVYASATARIFELASLASCIVSNPYLGLEEWFEPDREVFIVHSASEAVDTYRRLLRDDGLRHAVGQRARARVLAEHTYAHRVRTLLQILENFTRRSFSASAGAV